MQKISALAVAAAVALAASTASAAQVWVAPASQKIRPTTATPASAPAVATLAAAKNEFEAFHVVVSGQATGVSMGLEGLSDGQGHVISGRDVVLYREALINVTAPTGGDGQAGIWPDALIPDVDPIVGEKRNAFPFDVPAGENRSVLVDIHVPSGSAAGTYKGTLNVTGSVTASIPITLTVWDFEIPSTSTLKSAFGMAWNGPCMGHGDSGCSNVTAEQQLRARYVQAALDNHISIYAPSFTSSVDSSGNGSWADYDLYVGPFLDGTANTRLKGAKLTAVEIQGASTTPLVAAWSQHFKSKGWSSALFNYVCDEPPLTCQWTDIANRAAASRAADPAIPLLVTTTTDEAKAQGQDANINLYVPVVNFMDGKPGTQYAGNQRAKYGANVWWYQSCMSFGCSGVGPGYDSVGNSGWPTYAIDSDATRNRAQEWMSFAYNTQGELYYETTQAYFGGGDPWSNQYNFGGTGDGDLFYPGTVAKIGGKTEIPVESLRMKGIRDGMEDYELLAMAKSLGLGAQALQIAQGLYPHTYLSTTPPAAIDAARAELAQLILHALGKDVTTTGTGSGSGTASGGTGTAGTGTGTAGSGTPTSSGNGIASQAGGTRTVAPMKTGLAGLGYPGAGGCSSGGTQTAWLALPLLGMFALRRRRTLRLVRR